MQIGPHGPGGFELTFSVTTLTTTYAISLALLSWGLVLTQVNAAMLMQIGPIKISTYPSVWNIDA